MLITAWNILSDACINIIRFVSDEHTASRTKIYQEFRKNRTEADPMTLSSLFETGEGVIDVLHDNVLQAKLNESTGRYSL